ncbi:hypothetical protein ACLMJK_007613 [Lecanora helva]
MSLPTSFQDSDGWTHWNYPDAYLHRQQANGYDNQGDGATQRENRADTHNNETINAPANLTNGVSGCPWQHPMQHPWLHKSLSSAIPQPATSDDPADIDEQFECSKTLSPQLVQSPSSQRKREIVEHEMSHFNGRPGHLDSEYRCLEPGCQTETHSFGELRRHYRTKHCLVAPRHPCREPGCQYGGDNGFIRKDKLKSHQRNVHGGRIRPAKAFQPIKSKPTGIQKLQPKN